MLFRKIFFGLLPLSFVLAYPTIERAFPQENGLIARAKSSSKPSAKAPLQYTGGGVVENARKANNAPGRVIPKACKKVVDCSCPKPADGKAIHSTSCINGFCQCDNPVVNLFGGKFIEAVKAIGNAPITKAIGHLMQGLADVKQVVGIIAGAVLGPQAKAALKAALFAFPDTGPSHIDKATKGILAKVL